MTTTENKPKRKRGRPKKSETEVKQEPIAVANTKQLNQVWTADIYFNNGAYEIEAGRFTFRIPSKEMSIYPMSVDSKPASWTNFEAVVRGGIYDYLDSTTGTISSYVLESSNPNPEVWIENIEGAKWTFSGHTYIMKHLSRRYED